MPEDFVFANICGEQGELDVIFVHGLGGDAVGTWSNPKSQEQDGPFWPRWLNADIPGLSLYTLGYPASWFVRWAKKEMDLYERAKQVLETLAGSGFGRRPIVFVCHSMGGVLVKQILRTALEAQDAGWRGIGTSTRAIFFIATPHSGSAMANVFVQFSSDLSSAHMTALQQDTSELNALNEACRQNCEANDIAVHVYYEKFHTKIGLVVDRGSADPGIGTRSAIPIDADHIEISKPEKRFDTIYLSVRRRVSELVDTLAISTTAPVSASCQIIAQLSPALADAAVISKKIPDDRQHHKNIIEHLVKVSHLLREGNHIEAGVFRPIVEFIFNSSCKTDNYDIFEKMCEDFSVYTDIPRGIGQSISRQKFARINIIDAVNLLKSEVEGLT